MYTVLRHNFCQSQNYYGLARHGIKNRNINYNLTVPEIYELGVRGFRPSDLDTRPNSLSSNGALVAFSGDKTGRTPKDKRIVKDENTEDNVWWGNVNIPLKSSVADFCAQLGANYISNAGRIFIQDGYAGWDPEHRLKIRIVCTRSYHALFMRNMLIVPTDEELERDFADDSNIDFHIFNSGEFPLPTPLEGVTSPTSCQFDFTKKRAYIFGTQYAGEMKKGVFTLMNYLMPLQGILSMHCSATEGKDGNVTLYFGLSGTGKTTLSADPKRSMLGDDEHCWHDKGVFNIEGGCYAKCNGLSKKTEPDIYNAIKFGSLLENVEYHDNGGRHVDFNDISITENTRVSYPLEHIDNAKFPSLGTHPSNIIMLTCDGFGVLPPVSQLTEEQAMYHYISGYTSKMAGTEVGITEPTPTFSSCFGEAFLPLHPMKYAKLLGDKLQKHKTKVWLINTGWTGGKYGTGQRISLSKTRAIIDAIHSGELDDAEYEDFPIFHFKVPKNIKGVPSSMLNPRKSWKSETDFDYTKNKLALNFIKNFKKFEDQAQIGNWNVLSGGPVAAEIQMDDDKNH